MGDADEKIQKLYRYRPAVVAYLTRCGFPPEEVRDLTQTVFVRVCQNVTGYRGEATSGYLQKVARSVALNAIRDRHTQKREGLTVPETEASMITDRAPDPEESALARERSEWLRGALERLEPSLKTAMSFYLSDMSYDDMARTLGTTVSAVKSRLHAARKRLRELLGEEPKGLGGDDDQ